MTDFVKNNIVIIIMVILFIFVAIFAYYILKSKKRRRKCSFYINYILCRLGFKNKMKSVHIGMVHVGECYEPLVELLSHPKIILNDNTVERPVLLRKTIATKLYKIADGLPDDLYLKIYSAFRSRLVLYNAWKEEVEKMERENPDMGRAELLSIVSYKMQNPNVNMGGHDTGAAVDVALCDKNGVDLDFGLKYHDRSIKVTLTPEHKKNQQYLSKLMKQHDFVQQPGQWWHYSYKDRYWAAYKGKRNDAIYGPAEKEFENAGYVRIIKTNTSTINK